MQLKCTASGYLSKLFFIAMILLWPFCSISQNPANPITNGGAPVGELAVVPFDENMTLLFLLAGLAFAVIVTVKQRRKQQTD